MRTFISRALPLAAAWLLMACATEYTYVPETGVTTPMAGRVAAQYAIPPEAPRGEMRIASHGMVEVASQAAPGQHLSALHLRLIVSNSDTQDWTLDTREQRLDLDGHGQSAPAFGSASPGSPPPVVTIPPAGKRVVDLFFPLPADLQDAADLPWFDAIWQINTGQKVVLQRTPFERLRAEPVEYEAYNYGVDYYWGEEYWYNPLYPGLGFVGAVVPPPLIGHRVVVRHQPGHVGGGPRGPRGGAERHR